MLKMKKTSTGRRPQNIKSGISQQPPVRSYSNLTLKLRLPNETLQMFHIKMTSNGRGPQISKWSISATADWI
jgi:hypothetical protein